MKKNTLFVLSLLFFFSSGCDLNRNVEAENISDKVTLYSQKYTKRNVFVHHADQLQRDLGENINPWRRMGYDINDGEASDHMFFRSMINGKECNFSKCYIGVFHEEIIKVYNLLSRFCSEQVVSNKIELRIYTTTGETAKLENLLSQCNPSGKIYLFKS